MTGHTPGPWAAVRNPSYWEVEPAYDVAYPRPSNIPYSVADCCCSDPQRPDGGLQEANARLIAASPELLDCLKEARKHLGNADIDLAYIDEVIAKAEGRG